MSPALAYRFLSTAPPGKLIYRALLTSLSLGSCPCIQCKLSPSVVSDSLYPHGQAPLFMGVSRQEYQSELHFFLQGIFPTQGSNHSLLLCRQILYCLSYQFIVSQVTIFSSQSSKGRQSSHLTFNIPHTTTPREQVEEAVRKGRAHLLEYQCCVNGRCCPNVIYLSSFWQSLRLALIRRFCT